MVEEALRYDPPVQLLARVATEPMAVRGVHVDAGDIVLLLLAAAHRDPAAYPEPDRFDPGRATLGQDTRNLAFGMGPHFCLGAPLARLEGGIALTRFAQRVVAPRLLADPPPYKDTAALRGPVTMPLEFTSVTGVTL